MPATDTYLAYGTYPISTAAMNSAVFETAVLPDVGGRSSDYSPFAQSSTNAAPSSNVHNLIAQLTLRLIESGDLLATMKKTYRQGKTTKRKYACNTFFIFRTALRTAIITFAPQLTQQYPGFGTKSLSQRDISRLAAKVWSETRGLKVVDSACTEAARQDMERRQPETQANGTETLSGGPVTQASTSKTQGTAQSTARTAKAKRAKAKASKAKTAKVSESMMQNEDDD